jgi:hypothetical protein
MNDLTRQLAMHALWLQTRDRLVAKGLVPSADATLSVRCPDGTAMWFGEIHPARPAQLDWAFAGHAGMAAVHAAVHAARRDAGAVLWGGGPFGACLADVGGALPQVFDEQARHLGPMPAPARRPEDLAAALAAGGNVVLWRGTPLCVGATCARLALNAELLEKCAKAYVLAVAAGGSVAALPWLVRRIANGRLAQDRKRAAQAFGRGVLPEESKGY